MTDYPEISIFVLRASLGVWVLGYFVILSQCFTRLRTKLATYNDRVEAKPLYADIKMLKLILTNDIKWVYIYYTMTFEFDPEKSEANQTKHGIDFVEAQGLWEDPDRLLVPARTQGEPRLMLIARINQRHWSAIFTIRGDTTRIISVRRSRSKEVEQYEE